MVNLNKIIKNIDNLDLTFSFEVEPEDLDIYRIDIELKKISNERKVIIPHIFRKDGNIFDVKNFNLGIDIPLLDIHGVSMPGKGDNLYLSKIPEQFNEEISSHRNFPFLSFINRKGINKIALGIKEPEPGYKITGKLDEESCELRLEVKTLGSRLQKHIVNGLKLKEKIFLHLLMNLSFVPGMQCIKIYTETGLRKLLSKPAN